jgi:type VI secretion system secreted protein VgrG
MRMGKIPPKGQRLGIVPLPPDDAPDPAGGLLGIAPPPSQAGARLGNLSMQYETSARPGQEARAAARISTGEGDKGGVSYGAYQLSSTYKQPQQFLQREGARWADRFKGQDPAVRGGDYGKTWQAIAREDPKAFFEAQHAFIERTHYKPLVARVRERTGVDVERQPQAIRDAAWSAAVNHSDKGATAILSDGINNAKRLAAPSSPDFPTAALDLIYDRRAGYVRTLKEKPKNLRGLLDRYRLEHKDARDMLKPR